jgi:hypothetical protein
MDELMDLLVTDGSSSQISAENIETIRPNVAASIFDGDVNLDPEEGEEEFVSDVEINSEPETEE